MSVPETLLLYKDNTVIVQSKELNQLPFVEAKWGLVIVAQGSVYSMKTTTAGVLMVNQDVQKSFSAWLAIFNLFLF